MCGVGYSGCWVAAMLARIPNYKDRLPAFWTVFEMQRPTIFTDAVIYADIFFSACGTRFKSYCMTFWQFD